MDINTFFLAETVFGLIIYLLIGAVITRKWYSPAIEKVDEEMRRNGSMEEIGMFRTAFWCLMMVFFWLILGPYELKTDLRRWYPKLIQ